MTKNIVIAIDGYSSCGKSTLAKELARKIKIVYVDTGAMYRCVTLYFLDKNIDINDDLVVKDALKDIRIHFGADPKTGLPTCVFLNDVDVSDKIRNLNVANFVSKVSALKSVRQDMVHQQRQMSNQCGLVMDGRDIGTVVFPNADLKLFMTAKPEIRAERRWKELVPSQPHISFEEVLENLNERDRLDSTRTESPLKQAEDAIVIDNSYLTHQEQFELVLGYVKKLT